MAELSLFELSNRLDSVLNNQLGAANLLTTIKTVDGTGSGLDADLLDEKQYSDLVNQFLPFTGGTITGSLTINGTLTMNTNKIFTNYIQAWTYLHISSGAELRLESPSNGNNAMVSVLADGTLQLRKGDVSGGLFLGNATTNLQITNANVLNIISPSELNLNSNSIKFNGNNVPTINNSVNPKDGDIKVVGGVIYIYATSAWQQVFPAIYS